MAPVRCPLCGAQHALCGQRTTSVGIEIPRKAGPAMSGPLKKYDVEVNGMRTTLLLTDADAKKRGINLGDGKPGGGTERVTSRTPGAKTRVAANKGRVAPDKGGAGEPPATPPVTPPAQ